MCIYHSVAIKIEIDELRLKTDFKHSGEEVSFERN